MAKVVLDYKASVPSSMIGGTAPQFIPQIPSQLQVADLGMFLSELTTEAANNRVFLSADVGVRVIASFTMDIDADAPLNNRVELNATVGVAATDSNPRVIFQVFRNGDFIFSTQQGLQAAAEQFYPVKLTAIDFNVSHGLHTYTLTVERSTLGGGVASVAGPITFGGIAFGLVA